MFNRIRPIFLILIGVGFITWSFFIVLGNPAPAKYQPKTIVVEGKTISVEVVATDALRTKGLSRRESLPYSKGMLFVYEEPGIYGFWMKDMKFPIDILWLEERGGEFRIVGAERHATPESFPQVFYPQIPVRFILETNPGEL